MQAKPGNTEKVVLKRLKINPNQIPNDFPIIMLLKRKVSSVKQKDEEGGRLVTLM